MSTLLYDVAIIGAGFSGLSAALVLHKEGRNILVLEAQELPGGRVKTELHADGYAYEKGGQFFETYMTHVSKLVQEYGLTRRNVRKNPGVVAIFGEKRRILEHDFLEAGFLEYLFSEKTDPNFSGNLLEWALSLDLDEEGLAMIKTGCEEVMGRPIHEISFRSVYEFLSRFESHEDSVDYACSEGLGTLAGKMAADLGNSFRANSPVTEINRKDGVFLLKTAQGEVTAEQVIFAASPAVLGNINWKSSRDTWLNTYSQHFVAGKMIKIILRYESAFWLDGDFGSVGRTDNPMGFSVMDSSDPNCGFNTLTVFCGGTAAIKMKGKTEEQVLATVFDILEPMLGPKVRRVVTVIQTNWSDHKWVGGGYGTWAKPWEKEDPWSLLRKEHDGLHFSVAELASEYPGFIEGACRRGLEVAERILKK